jgi:signal transduction histidine kinase
LVKEILEEVVENMMYRNRGKGVEIRNKGKEEDNTDFRRMMENVIKNGIEAIEWKKGEVEKGEEVEIRVKDNGKGMPREMAEKIKRGEEVGTTKKEGYGIGMGQIMGTIKAMRGKIEIEAKEGEVTEFILTFPKTEKPRWFADKIEMKKGDNTLLG